MEKIYSVEQLPLHKFLSILLKNKILILIITILLTTTVVFFIPQPPAEYEAVSKILVKPKGSASPAEEQGMIVPMLRTQAAIKTYIELIKSNAVAKSVAKIILSDDITKTSEKGPAALKSESINELAYFILNRIDVDYIQEATVLRIRARTNDQILAIRITNLVANVFMNFNKDLERNEVKSALSYIIEQKGLAKHKLEQSELELDDYIKVANPQVLSDGVREIINTIAKLDQKYSELQITEALTRESIKELNRFLFSKSAYEDNTEIKQILPQTVKDLNTQLKELKENYSELSVFQKETHPDLIKLKNQIIVTEQRIAGEMKKLSTQDAKEINQFSYIYNVYPPLTVGENLQKTLMEAESELRKFDKQKNEITRQLEINNEKLKTLPLETLKHSRLVKNVETANNIYLRLQQREEELKIIEAKELGGLILYEKAEEAFLTVSPKPKSVTLILAISLGLIIGVSSALIKEYLDTTFKSPNDVLTILKLKVLGIIPEIIPNDMQSIERAENFSDMLITHFSPKSPAAEAFRALRVVVDIAANSNGDTALQALKESQGKTILITSSIPDEGKSICVSNIAMSFANVNKKVILIDTDTRKPSINRIFNIEQSPGLTDFVFKKNNLTDVIRKQVIPNLDIISSGEKTGAEIEFTSSKKFLALIEYLRKNYDFIIFDSPALLVVSDPVMLSTMMDTVLMLIRHNYTKYDSALKALRYLENVKAKIKGVIYNGVVAEKKYYYRYYEKQT